VLRVVGLTESVAGVTSVLMSLFKNQLILVLGPLSC
jgi:hypothetical protein